MDKVGKLEISGEISIEPVSSLPPTSWSHLIMGPTGAGKSSFVEALAGSSHKLSISKNQLAGYTQAVTAYKLLNVLHMRYPIYVIDTPGFSDNKISEIEIMDMVHHWFKANKVDYVDQILYMTPINETRLAGSKRRTIDMLKAFLRPSKSLGSVIFVTTMWDALHNEQALKRGEASFAQLRDELLKEFIDENARIVRFMNTQKSAVEALQHETTVTAFGNEPQRLPQLYQDLLERIQNSLQEKQMIELDLLQEDTQSNMELKSIMEERLKDNDHTLEKFIGQLMELGDPPPELHDSSQVRILRDAILASRSDIVTERIPGRTLALKGLLRRVFKAAKRRGNKWFSSTT